MLRYLNGGESHGKYLLAVIEGVPAGLTLSPFGRLRESRTNCKKGMRS